MAIDVYPFVPGQQTRNFDPQNWQNYDERYINVLVQILDDPVARSQKTLFANKRPGIRDVTTVQTGGSVYYVEDNFGFQNLSTLSIIWSGLSFSSCVGNTWVGSFSHTSFAVPLMTTGKSVATGEELYFMTMLGKGAYYIGETGMAGSTTFTANSSSGTSTLTAISSPTGLVRGQLVYGNFITGSTRISSVNAATSTVALTSNANTNSTGALIFRERMSKIIHSNFPEPIGPMVEVGGRFFVAAVGTQNVHNSSSGSIALWGASDFIPANKTNANLLGLSRQHEYVMAHKPDGIEYFFIDGANSAGSVLSRADNMTVRTGPRTISGGGTWSQIAGGASPIYSTGFGEIDDIVAFATDGLYLIENGRTKKVSTDVVDAFINGANIEYLVVNPFKRFGRYFILLHERKPSTATYKFLYDLQYDTWTELQFASTDPQVHISKHLGAIGSSLAGSSVIKYWPFAPGTAATSNFQDLGTNYTMTIRTGSRDQGTGAKKDPEYYELVADTQTSGVTTFFVSDDDFATTTQISSFNMTKHVKRIERGKAYEGGRAIGLEHSTNTPWRGQAIRMKYEVTGR